LTWRPTGTENVPDIPPMLTVAPLTDGVLYTPPDPETVVGLIVNEKVIGNDSNAPDVLDAVFV
jgi:hypothetical protein